jgi:hypothetical protein
MLFRQAHRDWVQDGEPTSQLFNPMKKDDGKASVALESLTTAEEAFVHYTTVLQLNSVGSWGVTVGEVVGVELTAYGDPIPEDPAHGFVDFRGLGRKPAERIAKLLLAKARAHGCLYAP